MPLIDFNEVEDTNALDLTGFDFTIIGCGAVGIRVALLLTEQAKSVLIIESGMLGEHAERQALNKVTVNRSDMASSAQWGRKRALGGTTIRWGGQALPFRELDFKERSWLKQPSWPLEMDVLVKHYADAERYLGVTTDGYYHQKLARLKLSPPFSSADLDYHVSKWAPQPNMFERHGKKLQEKTTVLFNAHCVGVTKSDAGKCTSVTVRNFKGAEIAIELNKLVIANGGLESARFLMLHQLSQSPALGQGFMEHPCMDLGVIAADDSAKLQEKFSTRMHRRQKYGIRLSLSEAAQINNQLTNSSASLMFETPESAFDPLRALSTFVSEKNPRQLLEIVKHVGLMSKSVLAYLQHGIVLKPFAKIRVTAMCEQLASDGSTLSLDHNHLDQFGFPRLKIHWVISEATWHSAKYLARVVKRSIENTFDVDVHLRSEFDAESLAFDSDIFNSVNHHMGGAVMGLDPGSSVVDPSLKLHDVENVWVISAAVFPTSSHSNPTLTALALGGRFVSTQVGE